MNTVVDRLANLPDEIAQIILCFLPGESLIRLGCVSKRYRKLCFKTCFLNFDDGFNLSEDGFTLIPSLDHVTWLRRAQCINSFMNLRHLEGTQMKSFSLCWFCGDSNDVSLVNKWLFQAFDSGVQEINLVMVPRRGFDSTRLPISILNCKTLEKLTMNLKNNRIVAPPSSVACLNFLEYLKLQSANLDGQMPFPSDLRVGELFSRSFKFLKELFLVDCTGSQQLYITSSSLLVFHLHYRKHHRQDHQIPRLKISARNLQELDVVWFPPFSTEDPSSFEIRTPKLQVFNWMGNPVRHFRCLTTLSHLERAALNLMEFPPNNSDYDVHEVVRSISNITCLQPLYMRSIVVLARCNGIPFMFHHLKSLVIVSSSLTANEAAPLRSLLMGTPNLSELVITSRGLSPYRPCSSSNAESSEVTISHSSYGSEFWESGLLFFGQLKILTIELYEGPFMLELFRFLLKNAQVLKKVTVYYLPPSFPQEAAAIISEFKNDSILFSIRAI